MKKIYSCLLVLGVACSVNAQTTFKSIKPYQKKTASQSLKNQSPATAHNKIVISEYDFSNISEWTVYNTGTPSADWVIGTDGPAGSFSEGMGVINSTSDGNFAMFDSDGIGSGASVQDASIQIATPVDLSSFPYVTVEFESYYRNYEGFCFLETSVDGTNWTSYPIHSTLVANVSTENPELVIVNVSASIGGASSAYIRFRYQGGWDYAWMIDDVKIVETPEFDLKLVSVNWGSVGGSTDTLAYTQVPVDQIVPTIFTGNVQNLGYTDQTDVQFNVVAGAFNSSSSPTAIATATSSILELPNQFTVPSTLGETMISFSVTSSAADANPGNNTVANDSIMVTNSVYARDHSVTTGTFSNELIGFEVGNIFDIFTTTKTDNITVKLSTSTDVGSLMYVKLLGGGFNYYSSSDDYEVQSTDLGNFVTLTLNDEVDLMADSTYIVVVGGYTGGETNGLVIATSGISKPQTSFTYDEGEADWFYVTATPVVRLNTSLIAHLKENANVSSFSVYPNPAKENVSISYELKNETNVDLKITDLSGKVVYTSKLGKKSGKNAVSVNTSSFSNGVYVVNFVTENGIVTEKLVINN